MRGREFRRWEATLAAMAEAFDSALADGAQPTIDHSELPEDVQKRWEGAQDCLRRLGNYWKPTSPTETQTRPIDDDLTPADGIASLGAPPAHRLGRFEIICELGRGGCGIVFLAYDPGLDRQVALKVPKPEGVVSSKLRRRFLREGQTAAVLNHPNIVPVYETGEDGPIVYITSEYCPGKTLSAWLKEQSVPVAARVAAELTLRLATAVAEAHAHGVLHRDLKPGNVLVRFVDKGVAHGVWLPTERRTMIPKLTDFGLAKLVESVDDDTRTGTPLGTPAYMSPEQARGQLGEIGPATDVFALGVILYEMLCGRPPFCGETDLDTLRQVEQAEPVGPRVLRPQLPRDLQSICLKALEKRPHHRYASAADMAADLERFLAVVPTQARPLSLAQRGLRWTRRHPTGAALWLVSLLALGMLISGRLLYERQLRSLVVDAQRARLVSESRERQIRRYVYPGDIRLAAQALGEQRVDEARRLLLRQFPEPGTVDLRNFTWRYLWQSAHAEEATSPALRSDLIALCWLKSANCILAGGGDGVIYQFDADSGRLIRSMTGHQQDVNAVLPSPDGQHFYSVGDDGTIRTWDLRHKRPLRTIETGNVPLLSGVLSPDGRWLFAGDEQGQTRRWDTRTWQAVETLPRTDMGVYALAVSPDGAQLAVSGGSTIGLWDIARSEWAGELACPHERVVCVAYAATRPWLACGTNERTVHVWNLETGKRVARLAEHRNRVESLAFSPDGNALVTAGKEGSLRVWDTQRWSLRRVLCGHMQRVWSVAFAPDGARLASTSADRTLKLWRIDDTHAPLRLVGHPAASWVGTAERGVEIVRGGQGMVSRWSPQSGRMLESVVLDSEGGDIFKVSRDGRLLLAANGKRLHICQWPESTPLIEPLEHPSRVLSADVSRDHRWVATISRDRITRLWSVQSGGLMTVLAGHHGEVRCLAFSPASDELATGSDEGEVIVWDLATWQPLVTLSAHTLAITDLAYSPDGRRLITASDDATAKVWDSQNGVAIASLLGHREGVTCVAVSPSEILIATGGGDNTIRLWTLDAGQELLSLEGHSQSIVALAFADAGNVLVGSSLNSQGDAETLLWRAPAPGTVEH